MENATKALLIAGAILLVIMIISVSLLIFNSTNGQVSASISKMSQQEKDQFNQKFLAYEGKKVIGSSVKELFNTVRVHNIQMKNEGTPEKYVSIYLVHAWEPIKNAEDVYDDKWANNPTRQKYYKTGQEDVEPNKPNKFEEYYDEIMSGSMYAVRVLQNPSTNLVDRIAIGEY